MTLQSAVRHLAAQPRKGQEPGTLAVDFDEAYTAWVDDLEVLPSESRLRSLQALDDAIARISGPENSELWTGQAFADHPAWLEIRSLARAILTEFGWGGEAPE